MYNFRGYYNGYYMNKLILAFFALFLSVSSFAQLGVMAASQCNLGSDIVGGESVMSDVIKVSY